jgi:DNA-binding LytR/AlgR family response regulator
MLFIDINMPDISGLDLVRSLQQKPLIIFTTAHKQFALEGFELDAVDYLLKPIQFDRFTKAVNKAIDYYKYKTTASNEDSDSLFVHAEYRFVKIPLGEIEYIESLGRLYQNTHDQYKAGFDVDVVEESIGKTTG